MALFFVDKYSVTFGLGLWKRSLLAGMLADFCFFLPDLEPEKPESESQLSVLSHFHPKYFPS